MQDEFFAQLDQIKAAFAEERVEFEKRVAMLQEEIEDVHRTRDLEDR